MTTYLFVFAFSGMLGLVMMILGIILRKNIEAWLLVFLIVFGSFIFITSIILMLCVGFFVA